MKKNRCIFTMVRNERFFLFKWIEYYSKFFEHEDMFVINHLSDNGSIEEIRSEYPNIKVIHLTEYIYFDDVYKVSIINSLQKDFLIHYKNVVYTDPDELIWVAGGLDSFLNVNDKKYIKCEGYELTHNLHLEPPLDPNKPILLQRRYWHPSPKWYSKTLIVQESVEYEPGLHSTKNPLEITADPEVKLIHIRRCDFDIAYQKNIGWQNLPRAKHNLGSHAFITDKDKFNSHFFGKLSTLQEIDLRIIDECPF